MALHVGWCGVKVSAEGGQQGGMLNGVTKAGARRYMAKKGTWQAEWWWYRRRYCRRLKAKAMAVRGCKCRWYRQKEEKMKMTERG